MLPDSVTTILIIWIWKSYLNVWESFNHNKTSTCNSRNFATRATMCSRKQWKQLLKLGVFREQTASNMRHRSVCSGRLTAVQSFVNVFTDDALCWTLRLSTWCRRSLIHREPVHSFIFSKVTLWLSAVAFGLMYSFKHVSTIMHITLYYDKLATQMSLIT